MDSSARTCGTLRFFRDSFYRCLNRRADALFELTDALLTAGSVPSPPHLSLTAVHRRGWGNLYAALSVGCMDEGGLRGLLARHPLGDGDQGGPPIYAVDVSVWPRCDAEASPERGYYRYHPSRHSAGQPIVAGWAYQLVAQIGFERDSWVAPVDVRRVRPAEDTDEVAAEQVRALVERLPESKDMPIFVFDAGYDPVKLQRGLEGCPARILVRLHSNRVFYAAPEEVDPRPVGRPRRHGEKFDLKDPGSWPEPVCEHRCESDDYGSVRVRCWADLHPKTRRIGERYGCERAPARRARHRSPGRGGQVAQADPQAEEALAVVERGGRGGPRPHLAGVLPQVRPRTHDPLPEANPGLDCPPVQASRASRPVDVAGARRLRATETGARHRRRRKTAVGATATASAANPDPRPPKFRAASGNRGHSSEATETLRKVSRASAGQPLGAGQTSSGAQNGRLSRPEKPGSSYVLVSRSSSDNRFCL